MGSGGGCGLGRSPVILHLFMRQTPAHHVSGDAAARERQRRSRQRLRIKNWLLLLARMAYCLDGAGAGTARLYSQVPLGDESCEALGLVFDTSLSMKYKDKDKTTLSAKERAREIIAKIPIRAWSSSSTRPSRGTPLSPSPPETDRQPDDPRSQPALNVAMGEVYDAVADCDGRFTSPTS